MNELKLWHLPWILQYGNPELLWSSGFPSTACTWTSALLAGLVLARLGPLGPRPPSSHTCLYEAAAVLGTWTAPPQDMCCERQRRVIFVVKKLRIKLQLNYCQYTKDISKKIKPFKEQRCSLLSPLVNLYEKTAPLKPTGCPFCSPWWQVSWNVSASYLSHCNPACPAAPHHGRPEQRALKSPPSGSDSFVAPPYKTSSAVYHNPQHGSSLNRQERKRRKTSSITSTVDLPELNQHREVR